MNVKKNITTASESVTISYAHGEADFSDLVHVVRCKDCAYWFKEFERTKANKPCDYLSEFCGMILMPPDGYCGFGERKE